MHPVWLVRICLVLLLYRIVVSRANSRSERRKREWILPPTRLYENVDYTKKEFVAKIRSDKDINWQMVEYELKGHGADKAPYHLFVINPENGFVRVTGLLDREKTSLYNLTGMAKYRNGTIAEENIELQIKVEDQNDNTPIFKLQSGSVKESSKIGTLVMQITATDADEPGTINSKIAYSIVKQTPAEPKYMFSIDKETGKVYMKEKTLDREKHDTYTLIVQGVDMNGAPSGNTGTGTVEIHVLDINDNVPTLEKEHYSGSVDEGASDVVVMRIKALDNDLEFTDNWLAVFDIHKGNEDNLFTIETDPKTNEGILKLVKPVDFEKVKELDLSLVISNVAPFINGSALELDVNLDKDGVGPAAGIGAGAGMGTGLGVGIGVGLDVGVGAGLDAGLDAGVDLGAGLNVDAGLDAGLDLGTGADVGVDADGNIGLKPDGKPGVKPGAKPDPSPGVKPGSKPAIKPSGKGYPVKISVNNLPDGPIFSPSLKNFPVSEDPDNKDSPIVLGTFAALDGDTGKPAENVRYAKGHDPDNWLTIDEETAEIKLKKVPDRESKFLVNGTYFAKIICMTQEVPSKTATGTIALKVEDSNDHCPTLTSTYHQTCDSNKVVNVTAFDEDADPNAAPYQFVLIEEESVGKWEMVAINETTVSFHAHESLWKGIYELTVKISDAQGLSCPESQKFEVEVCTCEKTGSCGPRLSALRGTQFKIGVRAIGLFLSGAALLLLVPFLLIFCKCGTVSEFKDLPFDAKEYLVSYHTEGIGDDKEVPLLNSPVATTEQKQLFQDVKVSNAVSSMPFQTSVANDSRMLNQEIKDGFTETDNRFWSCQNTLSVANQRNSVSHSASFMHEKQNIYQDMAVGDEFLNEYFSQKSSCAAAKPPLTDGLLEYEYEGQGTPAGSVGCCSFFDSDDDLEFLNNLGSKFLTLADICHPPKPCLPPPKIEQVVKSVESSYKSENSVNTSTIQVTKSPQQVQQTIHAVETINKSATFPSAKARQTLFVQQQPVFYLVEQQMPNTVIVESPIQGVYIIDGNPGTESLRNVSQATLSREQQAMYVINEAPVTAHQPIQEQEAVLGFSPVSSPIGAPGGVLLMQTHFHENSVQRETGKPPLFLVDVPATVKKHKKKTPSEPPGTKVV